MNRIDLVSFRKSQGVSQRALADMLEIRPSFLSAIENGRSRLPEDRLEKLKAIYGANALDGYIMEECHDAAVPPHTHLHDEGDSLTQLLNHFHDLAHQRSDSSGEKQKALADRVDFLSLRNDRLSERLDDLRDEVDALRAENLRLKELLIKNGIAY